MLIRRLITALMLVSGGAQAADVVELSIDADYCAIKRAMTGKLDEACPVIDPPGAGRGVGHEALPVSQVKSDRGYSIHFAFASDELTQDYRAHLKRLSKVLKSEEMLGLCVKLVGHTDAVGSARYNLSLSKKRAETVRLFLVGAMGVSEKRLQTEGRGEKNLLRGFSGADSRNRRVEILVKQSNGSGCIV